MSDNISYKIIRNIGVLPNDGKSWNKKLKLVSWNEAEPKYDLRPWNPEDRRLGRGVTMTENELRSLFEIIRQELVHLEEELPL